MLLGTGEGYIEQTTLFFETLDAVAAHGTGEEVLFHSHHKHGTELQALGSMDGHDGYLGTVVACVSVEIGEE